MLPVSSVPQIDALLANYFISDKEKVVSLILQYQIDEFIKEVKGDLAALSPAKKTAVQAAAQGVTFLDLQGMTLSEETAHQFEAMFPNLQTVIVENTSQFEVLSPEDRPFIVKDETSSWPLLKLKLFVREPSTFFVNEVMKIGKIQKRVKGLAEGYLKHIHALKTEREHQISAFLRDESESMFNNGLLTTLVDDAIHKVAHEKAMTYDEVKANIDADIVEARINTGKDLRELKDFVREVMKVYLGCFTQSERDQIGEKADVSYLLRHTVERAVSGCVIL